MTVKLTWKQHDRVTWKAAASPTVGGRYVIARMETFEEAYDIRHFWGRGACDYDLVALNTEVTSLDQAKAVAQAHHDQRATTIAQMT
jgi:hypothetical protein